MLIDIDAPLAIDAPRRQEISVRRVRSLLAVVTHNSFSKAAQELGLTQPAVTQHVQQLERQLGVSLLTRDPTGFRLSPAGAALLPAFRRLMSSNGAILDQLNSLSQGTSQILRVASPASFAALCGLAPIPASSGKTTRHRLCHGGDRQANRALYTIAITRIGHCTQTKAHLARRTRQGKTKPEIIRCLKRYLARELLKALTSPNTTQTDLPPAT